MSSNEELGEKSGAGGGATFVKVSMDGAPYLRKVDLKMYSSYQLLSDALAKMFSSFTMGKLYIQLASTTIIHNIAWKFHNENDLFE